MRSALFEHGVIVMPEQHLSPDQHIKLAEFFGEINVNRFFTPVASHPVIAEVRTSPNQAEVNHLIGELENLDVLIIDDMIDTAGTTVNASKAAMEKGAKSVTAVATHGVLSGPAIKRLNDSDINKIIITDTISIDRQKKADKIKIVSVAKIFGEAVNRVHNGESGSALFEF